MRNRDFFALFALTFAMNSQAGFAGDINVKKFRYTGSVELKKPVLVDTINIEKKKFDAEMLLKTPMSIAHADKGQIYSGAVIPETKTDYALNLLQFRLVNTAYTKANISVGKLKHYEIYVDGEKSDGNVTLTPNAHSVVIKYLSKKGDKDSLDVKVSADNERLLTVDNSNERLYSLSDVMNGKQIRSNELSADGRYIIVASSNVLDAKTTRWTWEIKDLKNNNTIVETSNNISWVPNSNKYYFTRKGTAGRDLVVVDVQNGKETIIARNLPEGSFRFSPKGNYIVMEVEDEGAKDDKDVHQYIEMDDRQPGWRDRSSLLLYDLNTGIAQPLTYGYHNTSLLDISRDGRYVLYQVSKSHPSGRPTTVFSYYMLDVQTMQQRCLIKDDGFVASAKLSPDAKYIAVAGSPECLGGIGKNVPEGMTPSMYDYQLYVVDCNTGKAKALTKYFNPSISDMDWNAFDGKIYFTALDKDYQRLYSVDIKSGKISQIRETEDLVNDFSMADKNAVLAYIGQGANNSDRLYKIDLKSGKETLIEDVNPEKLNGVTLGECKAWNFINSRGDTIYGRYYLPPHFDTTKKYPMIVNYYGGCSPTSRNFESRYPHHAYAAQGYVVYVVEPSGAAGFGQEFAARHVNTAGEGPAQDIIEGTKKFCEEHSFVDAKKIGCIGASYGGFMTQYLQTKTDIFAAAISHAGISDHTSYWGEGYWGYNYSEVAMANSYPWANKELYVDRSPLFNADKIHTPLLFLHGTADTNVPVGESIQMYTALKLLQRPTALVVVEGENHHILDYEKRVKWQNTIFAWFAKYLKDDASWWNSMYDKVPE